MLFKKRWSDGLNTDFEDDFESKFGLFGGDGGGDGGGGGDVSSQVDSFSDISGNTDVSSGVDSFADMPSNVDVATQVDTFADIPSFSAPAAAPASAPSMSSVSPAARAATPAVDTFSTIGNVNLAGLSIGSTPMGLGGKGLGSLAEEQLSYDPFSANPFGIAQAPSAMYSGGSGLGFLSENAMNQALGSYNMGPTTPAQAFSNAVSVNPLSTTIGGYDFSLADGGLKGQFGPTSVTVAPTFLDPGITIGVTRPFKDGGIVSLLRR